ncbi:hypothetical protein DUNSADRAFT_17349 [Dunaliella salina]|uniref:Encoded protein n=1 Tax=Dunaliella salina TaxID=3046 RepID=A0ABQ7H062_DUNSA|nr:hypothetical protein DUNSADRAFT_17349 [Dunaliella salina]|eukprot:KAF5840246.1 hypothetical protein DUNSADRAFT_17349 [Dunaliella salina]
MVRWGRCLEASDLSSDFHHEWKRCNLCILGLLLPLMPASHLPFNAAVQGNKPKTCLGELVPSKNKYALSVQNKKSNSHNYHEP